MGLSLGVRENSELQVGTQVVKVERVSNGSFVELTVDGTPYSVSASERVEVADGVFISLGKAEHAHADFTRVVIEAPRSVRISRIQQDTVVPTPEVIKVLDENGIFIAEFQRMVKGAAILTHTLGNRRFHGWIFLVKDGVCESMKPWIKEVERPAYIERQQVEQCSECLGKGCTHCDFVGNLLIVHKRKQRSVSNEKPSSSRKHR